MHRLLLSLLPLHYYYLHLLCLPLLLCNALHLSWTTSSSFNLCFHAYLLIRLSILKFIFRFILTCVLGCTTHYILIWFLPFFLRVTSFHFNIYFLLSSIFLNFFLFYFISLLMTRHSESSTLLFTAALQRREQVADLISFFYRCSTAQYSFKREPLCSFN